MESIEKQKRGVLNFEVIVVDDGSPDNSVAIVRTFENKIPNLKIIHQHNQGLSVARNVGLQNAIGQFVWFIDSDDTITSDAFEVIHDVIKTNADIYAFDMNKIDAAQGGKQVESVLLGEKNFSLYGKNRSGIFFYRKIHNGAVPRFVFSRKFIKDNTLQFYPGVYFEDIDFLVRAQICAKRILPINKAIYNYLLRDSGSIMTSFRLKHLEDMWKIIDRFKLFYHDKRITKKEKAIIGDVIFQQIYKVLMWDERKIEGYEDYMKNRKWTRWSAVKYGIQSLTYFSVGKVAKMLKCVFVL